MFCRNRFDRIVFGRGAVTLKVITPAERERLLSRGAVKTYPSVPLQPGRSFEYRAQMELNNRMTAIFDYRSETGEWPFQEVQEGRDLAVLMAGPEDVIAQGLDDILEFVQQSGG